MTCTRCEIATALPGFEYCYPCIIALRCGEDDDDFDADELGLDPEEEYDA